MKGTYPNSVVTQPTNANRNQNVLSPVNRSVTGKARGLNESKKYDNEASIDDEPAMNKKKPKNCNVKVPILPTHVNFNQAMTLQTEANNLLKHIISQNNKQIQLLTQLLKK